MGQKDMPQMPTDRMMPTLKPKKKKKGPPIGGKKKPAPPKGTDGRGTTFGGY